MHIIAIHRWQRDDAEVAKAIANTMGLVVFEARQKIAGGGPAVLASFADVQKAEALAKSLCAEDVPTLLIDVATVRNSNQFVHVHRFVLGPRTLQVEGTDGESREIDYGAIDLLLVATCTAGQMQTTTTETQRK